MEKNESELDDNNSFEHPENGWFDDDWDNYGFDQSGQTTERDFGQ